MKLELHLDKPCGLGGEDVAAGKLAAVELFGVSLNAFRQALLNPHLVRVVGDEPRPKPEPVKASKSDR